MNRGIFSVILLIASNAFMTFAWYGHLKFKDWDFIKKYGLPAVILISWSIALFEYVLQVPANRLGFEGNGGPFNLVQLKVIQEVITLLVFVIFSVLMFPDQSLRSNHIIGFLFLILGVYFVFKN
jgi:uncharacterized protein (DUF486 family)